MANRKWYGWTGRMLRATGLLIGLGLVALSWGLVGIHPQPAAAAGDIQIAAGYSHTCALVNGGVKCWGSNSSGQLGDGTTTYQRTMPVDVSGLTSGVTAIATRFFHTCAVVNGGVKCWGNNSSGELGNNSTASSYTPVDVSGLTSGVTAITAGHSHTCAVVNGGVKCWGVTTESYTPVDVSGLTSGVTAIAAGSMHTCAVVNGGIKCWGYNLYGQLGDGTTTTPSKLSPVDVIGLTSGVTNIAAGSFHTCAVVVSPSIYASDSVKCWGENKYGKLGDGTTTAKSIPVAVSGLTSGVTAIAAGSDHTCAVVSGGMKCWGQNLNGKLGDGTTTDSSSPVAVSGLTSGVTAIATGSSHTCALVNGGMKCWGENTYSGNLGNGTTTNSWTPVDVVAKLNLKQGTTAISSTGSYDFGLVKPGSTKVVSFTIENSFPGFLKLTGSPKKIAVTGQNASEFKVDESSTLSPVAAGASTTFLVTFTPSTWGSRTASLTLASNDPSTTIISYTVNLKGTGVEVTATPTATAGSATLTPTMTPVASPTATTVYVALSPTPSPTARSSVAINYQTGKPGSYFTFTTRGFLFWSLLNVLINKKGNFPVTSPDVFSINTNGGKPGTYQVDVERISNFEKQELPCNIQAWEVVTTSFTLDDNAPLRARDLSVLSLNEFLLPSVFTKQQVYLPLITR